jgi:hypothetical protein
MSKKNKIDRKKFKKMSIEDRVQMVENLYIDFPRNDKTIKAIRQHHAYAKFASEPEGLLIQGSPPTILNAPIPLATSLWSPNENGHTRI